MLSSSKFTRSAVIAASALSLTASPAVARLADMPTPKPAVTASVQHTQRFTEPRVDGMARRPIDAPATATPVAATPLTRDVKGPDWVLIGTVAVAILALLSVAAIGTTRHSAHPFRARRI